MTDVHVVPLEKASEEQIENPDAVLSEIKSHMTQWMPELEWIE